MQTVTLKDYLLNLIAEAKIDKALDVLLDWAKKNDADLESNIILLKARHTGLKNQMIKGLIGNGEASIARANITNSLVFYVNSVPNDAVIEIKIKGSDIPVETQKETVTPPQSNDDKYKILMMTANPSGTTKLNLDKEYARISEKLQDKISQYPLTVKRAVNRNEFKEFTETIKPTILHFSGHGTSDGSPYSGIVVQNDDKNGFEMMAAAKLGDLFDYFKDECAIQAVILNACHSDEQAAAIAKHVPYVIGTTKNIDDEHAIAFSVGFYFKLANSGLDFVRAYKSGRVEASGAGANKSDFVLYQNAVKMMV